MTDRGLVGLVETVQQVAGGPAELSPLDVSADLTVVVDGHELAVEAYTDRVFVEFPSLGAAVDVIRAAPDPPDRPDGAEGASLPELLAAADLTAVASVAGRDVATLGAAGSGLLAYAGYEKVKLRPRGLVLAALDG